MRRLIIFFFLVCCLTIYFSHAQNLNFAKSVIDTLCSDSFAGRGYADKGIHKAADFIEKHFSKAGLTKFGESYRQNFTISTNVITFAKAGNRGFQPGENFVVNINSGNFRGTRKVQVFEFPTAKIPNPTKNNQKYKDKFVLFLPSMMEDKNQADYIRNFIYKDKSDAAGYIIGTLKQPVWDAQYFGLISGKPIITIKGNEDDFLKLRKLKVRIEAEPFPKFPVVNLAGYFPGKSNPDSLIVFCAHYDHLGKMGNIIYPGANDNASGVAMMLDLMHYFSGENNRLPYSVAFIAFASEEAGILGAEYFSEHPLFDLKKIRFLINLDLVGTGKSGIQVVNGSIFEHEFGILIQINSEKEYLPEIRTRGEACNSDHCPFYKKGVPCFFIFSLDPDYPWYHVPEDNTENLPLTAYENLFRLLVDFSKEITSENPAPVIKD